MVSGGPAAPGDERGKEDVSFVFLLATDALGPGGGVRRCRISCRCGGHSVGRNKSMPLDSCTILVTASSPKVISIGDLRRSLFKGSEFRPLKETSLK